ncbi:MAG: ABC transporter substrate-binding protein [Chloroflexota bacterium]|nr:ABC transporter substrate-binding protein [Chloroflexota bacterium]
MTRADETDTAMIPVPLSRRTMLRGIAAAGASGALGALLAACGGSSAAATNTAAPAATKPAGAATTQPAAAASGVAGGAPTAAGATSAPAAGAVKKGGTLKAGLDGDILTFDPLTSGAYADREVYYNVYDTLVAFDTNLQIVPALAEKWETPDPKTYIFHIRQGVKFHDGTDLNADAVKFNIDRYLTDKTSRRKAEIDTITSVDVMDPYTVKFSLKAPFAPLLPTLADRAGMILSPKVVQALGPDALAAKPVGAGSGPFKFVEAVKDDHITFERNPNYWKKDAAGNQLPYVDKLIYRPILDATVLLANLKTGDLDISYSIAAKDVAGVKSGSELVIKDVAGLGFNGLGFNVAKEPFNKKELRQAVAEALDRDQINKTVYFGVNTVAQGAIPPSSWAFDANYKPYGANIAKAKEYLKAGGKPDGFTFDFKVGSGSPTTTQLAQLIKDQLAKAGITANLVQEERTTLSNDQNMGNFQMLIFGWSGRADPDGNLYNIFHTGGGLNYGGYSSPMVDDLLEKARAAGDQAQRKDLYQQAQKLIVDDAAMAFYSFVPAYLVMQPKVQGVQLYPDFMMRFDGAWLK